MNSVLRATLRQSSFLTKQVSALSSCAPLSSKVYELRIYSIKPSYMAEYIKLTKENFESRLAHSKLTGFWTTEIGGINEAVHIWEYDSLAHRASVRAGLAADSAWWDNYLSKAIRYFDRQHNQLVTAEELDAVPVQEGGVYQLCALDLDSAGGLKQLKDVTALQQGILEEGQMGKLIALLRTQIGDTNIAYQLWNYKHADDVLKCKEALDDHKSITADQNIVPKPVSSRLLIPLPTVSPLM